MSALIAIDDAHWFVRDQGRAEAPATLLIHGFTGCAQFWDAIVDRLTPEFRCVTVDLAGHGQTRVPARIELYRLPAVADALARVMTEIGIVRAHVWGYSMGGRLALQFALRHPNRCDRLVLESASPGIADATERANRRRADDALADRIEQIGVDAFVAEWMAKPIFAGQQALPQTIRERASALRKQHTAEGLAMSLRGMGTGAQEPLHDLLPSLATPTLILAGEHDPKFRAIGAQMHDQVPNSVFRIVPGVGHAPYWEAPERTVSLVTPFLNGDEPPQLVDEEG